MDILWLIGLLAINLLCGSASAHRLSLQIPQEFIGRGTQYRFQYFVRDEHGDYKTQEEAGNGGVARGSYAVAEPDGDIRIVQYTADIEGGFKAHIKVDHADRFEPSNIQEIDIPAKEMRKLIEENRKKAPEEGEAEASRSYVLGPPRKMSDIVMEQAAAIRQIISREIEAEDRRKKIEDLKNERQPAIVKEISNEVQRSSANADSERSAEPIGDDRTERDEAMKTVNSEQEKATNNTNLIQEASKSTETVKEQENVQSPNDDSVKTGQVLISSEIPESAEIIAPVPNDRQTPIIRVALGPKTLDLSQGIDPENVNESESQSPKTPNPVRNFSFKNRITFYKPAERKLEQIPNMNSQQEITADQQENEKRFANLNGNRNDENHDPQNSDQIVLYSPFQQMGHKTRYVSVPYAVLRPYMTPMAKE